MRGDALDYLIAIEKRIIRTNELLVEICNKLDKQPAQIVIQNDGGLKPPYTPTCNGKIDKIVERPSLNGKQELIY